MKHILTIALVIAISHNVFCQTSLGQNLVGSWKLQKSVTDSVHVSYSGPWGPSINTLGDPVYITFIKQASTTYYVVVETETAPNGTYNPATDSYSLGVTCE